MPEENRDSQDRDIEFVALIHKDTLDQRLMWQAVPPASVGAPTKRVLAAFETVYNGQAIRAEEVEYERGIRTYNSTSLRVVGEHGNVLYSLTDTEGLSGLLRAIKRQLFDPDEYIKSALSVLVAGGAKAPA